MIKTAIIMAAGLGSRFGEMTESMPKGFIEVGGKPMVIRSIETLIACGIERILIGTGYKYEIYDNLKTIYPQIETCYSSRYAETNSMYTLWNMRELIGSDDFLLLESDIIYEKRAILSLLNDSHKDILLASSVLKFQDQYYVEIDNDGFLSNCSINKDELRVYGEFVGVHKISNELYRSMCKDYSIQVIEKPKMGYEYQLVFMSKGDHSIYVLKINDLLWYEIDDENDLEYAENHVNLNKLL